MELRDVDPLLALLIDTGIESDPIDELLESIALRSSWEESAWRHPTERHTDDSSFRCEAATSHERTDQQQTLVPSSDQPAEQQQALVASSTSSGTKRKRSRGLRPTQELIRLKQEERKLQHLLGLLKQRRQSSASDATRSQDRSHTAMEPAWQGVASRQFHRLQQAITENGELRCQVQTQIRIVMALAKLLKRAQNGVFIPSSVLEQYRHLNLTSAWMPQLPNDRVSGISSDEATARTSFARRQHQSQVEAMYHSVDQMLASVAAFSSFHQDFIRIQIPHELKHTLVPGSVLGLSIAGYFVPLPRSELRRSIWLSEPSGVTRNRHCDVKYQEESDDQRFIVHEVSLPLVASVPKQTVQEYIEQSNLACRHAQRYDNERCWQFAAQRVERWLRSAVL